MKSWVASFLIRLFGGGVFCGLLAFDYGLSFAKPIDRKDLMEEMRLLRPSDLVVLLKEPGFDGESLLGIYAIKADKYDSDLRRFKLWEEKPNDLNIYTESVRCAINDPLRVKRTTSAIYVRRLNPGGEINRTNMEDHLVWWAACVPDVAGINPQKLRNKAISLGFSTEMIESQEILSVSN